DGAGNDHDIRAFHMRGGVPEMHGRTRSRESVRGLGRALVRTRDPIAERAEHFGDAAHADATDAHEMHVAEAGGEVGVGVQALHAASARTASATTLAASGLAKVRAASARERRSAASSASSFSSAARRAVNPSPSVTSTAAPAPSRYRALPV